MLFNYSMPIYKRASSDVELKQILELQKGNLPKNLTQEEMEREGFLTIEHSFLLLKEMNELCNHTLAVAEGKIIGYALSMHPYFCKRISVLEPMFAEINKVISKNTDYCVMGQICISKDYRGQGVFKGLYEAMRNFIAPDFSKIITEVDIKNKRSLRAHRKIGFKELKRYVDGDKEWSLIFLE